MSFKKKIKNKSSTSELYSSYLQTTVYPFKNAFFII